MSCVRCQRSRGYYPQKNKTKAKADKEQKKEEPKKNEFPGKAHHISPIKTENTPEKDENNPQES